jgi:hypothetical protein
MHNVKKVTIYASLQDENKDVGLLINTPQQQKTNSNITQQL